MEEGNEEGRKEDMKEYRKEGCGRREEGKEGEGRGSSKQGRKD